MDLAGQSTTTLEDISCRYVRFHFSNFFTITMDNLWDVTMIHLNLNLCLATTTQIFQNKISLSKIQTSTRKYFIPGTKKKKQNCCYRCWLDHNEFQLFFITSSNQSTWYDKISGHVYFGAGTWFFDDTLNRILNYKILSHSLKKIIEFVYYNLTLLFPHEFLWNIIG